MSVLKTIVRACLPLFILAGNAAAAAEQVVVESRAARYVVGTILDSAAAIVLATGEFLVLATDDGRLLRVVGPHNGPAAGTAPDEDALRKALALLVAQERSQLGGVGGVRGGDEVADTEDSRPEPWLVHAERSGDQCVLRGAEAGLWRESVGDGSPWEIQVAASDQTASLAWDTGERRAPWPAALAPQDGEIYLVRPAAALRSVAIRTHLLDPGIAGSALGATAWLAAKGCTPQARLILRLAASSP